MTIRTSLALLAATIFGADAATLSFLSNTTVTSDSALDAVLVLHSSATLAQAATYGGSAQTVNTTGGQTIAFALGATDGDESMPAAPSSSTVVYNGFGQGPDSAIFPGTTGDTQFDNVLRSNAWHSQDDSTKPLTLRVAGLTVGQEYVISLFSADARSTDRSQAYWDTYSGGSFSGGTSGSFSQNPATMTMFSFTADASGFQDIFIQETDNIGFDDTNLAGFTLYAVPEPSAAVLVGSMGLLSLLRRRRA